MNLIKPMLAKSGTLPPDDDNYGFEIKWDGLRTILYFENGCIRLLSRNHKDITKQYPELQQLKTILGPAPVVLDGEIVHLDKCGCPSFSALQYRMGLTSEKSIMAKMQEFPVTYIIFDLLYLGGDTLTLTLAERRQRLLELNLAGPAWQTPAHQIGGGQAMLTATRKLGLEGIIAKRLDSIYLPGKRTNNWLKIKNQLRQELVIGGWQPGKGARLNNIGALLVGYYNMTPEQAAAKGMPQQLRYAGKVGTGFTVEMLSKLAELLAPLRRETSPFATRPPVKEAIFTEPRLVGEFEFTEWTPNHTLRHPVFKGLRHDKEPHSVIREQ